VSRIYVEIGRSLPSRVEEVEIGLEDVRAANSIKVRYDYDRDGWVVCMDKIVGWELKVNRACSWPVPYYEPTMVDQEVAFIPAWIEGDLALKGQDAGLSFFLEQRKTSADAS
jgi:hypothetical protein